jgi:cytoskeletal protein RodZ
MHNRAIPNTDKAAAARAQRKLVRSRSLRRVAFSTIALFALVFTLLSFRLTAGLDPSSSGNTVATTSTPSTQSAISDEDELEEAEEEAEEAAEEAAEAAEEAAESIDDDSSGSSSVDSPISAAPTTRAS